MWACIWESMFPQIPVWYAKPSPKDSSMSGSQELARQTVIFRLHDFCRVQGLEQPMMRGRTKGL